MAAATLITGARRSHGFTMTELLIVVAILGILGLMGAPSMRDLIASSKVKGAASDMYASLIFARSEAIKRNSSVDIVPAQPTNWGAGWSVRLAGTTENLSIQQPVTADITFGGPASSIRYRGDGRLVDPATGSFFAAEVPFTFRATEFSHVPLRCLDIAPSGRPSVRTDKDRNPANGCNG